MKKIVCKFVMLPASTWEDGLMLAKCIKPYSDIDGSNKTYVEGQLGLILTQYANMEHWQPQHLYLLSDEKLEEVDYSEFAGYIIEIFRICTPENTVMFLNPVDNKYITLPGIERFKKLEATTDNGIGVPRIKKEIIDSFINSQGQLKTIELEF